MNRKNTDNKTGKKIEKIRLSLDYSTSQMAKKINLHNVTYNRIEKGKSIPSFNTLRHLGNNLDVSLDWLICDKGEMFFPEKNDPTKTPQPQQTTQDTTQETGGERINYNNIPEPQREDVKELLEHMENNPRLRYEILAQFYRFKEEKKE